MKWHILDIDTCYFPPFAQALYMLPLKHSQWVQDELEIPEKARIIFQSISPWSSPIVIIPKKAIPGQMLQKWLHLDYGALNSLLAYVVKAHSKDWGVLSLVSLPKIDELHAMLNVSMFTHHWIVLQDTIILLYFQKPKINFLSLQATG